jgi:pyruvate formate lyase activating enzyme
MKIAGLQKTTFLDYPDKVACVIFTAGCNMRCPFCHNKELVIQEINESENQSISESDFFEFLDKRKDILEGVVITGGEPTLQPDLEDFCQKIKAKGFLVKLDTNGTNPDIVKRLMDKKLIDFVAMDMKNDFENYQKTVGVPVDLDKIKKSIDLIQNWGGEYEFRTTVVPTLHTKKNIENILKIIPKNKLVLQRFRPNNCLNEEFNKLNPVEKEDIEAFDLGVKIR